MKGLSPKEKADTLKSFVSFDEEAYPLVDRSQLEAWSVCPAQAALLESGKVNNHSAIAAAGEEGHRAISQAIAEYIGTQAQMQPGEIANAIRQGLYNSRPDVQPDAIEGLRRAVWDFAEFLAGKSATNLLRYDGGEGDKSGQLAHDAPQFKVRVTSEIDLLYAGFGSPKVLYELDYKTGWKPWSCARVAQSFQFQLHWWLVSYNYPEVEVFRPEVWHTRKGRTYGCEFTRQDLPAINARILHVLGLRHMHQGKAIASVPTWPEPEKCFICPARLSCPVQYEPTEELDAEAMVDRMVALEAKLSRMQELCKAKVNETGRDIVTAAGNAYGAQKPKAERRTMALYRAANQELQEED